MRRASGEFTGIVVLVMIAAGTMSCNSLIDPDGEGIRNQTLVTGGLIRFYDWVAPSGDEPRPVLLMFHGYGGNATEIRTGTRIAGAGKDAGYVVVFPQAANEANRGWAVGCDRCTEGDAIGIDDVAFVDAVLNDLEQRTPIDRSRVYAAGFSRGGWFTYALACKRANMIRAIAPVGGLMLRPLAAQCAPSRPIGALVIFGDQDQTQPYHGRVGEFGLFSADSSATFWANAAQCSVTQADERRTFGSTLVDVAIHSGCHQGISVERHRVIGLTHVWPRGSYDATGEILRFFNAH